MVLRFSGFLVVSCARPDLFQVSHAQGTSGGDPTLFLFRATPTGSLLNRIVNIRNANIQL